ncbi:TPA: PTS sugar transporter subunit IIB [Escherichia coli]|nr:PTS sugar transporter subunit IIB [Escherichia coli]
MIITAICGHAIGSSFIIGHNVEKILKSFNIQNEVRHVDILNVDYYNSDIFIIGKDMFRNLNKQGYPRHKFIILNSIVDEQELKSKLESLLRDKKIIN